MDVARKAVILARMCAMSISLESIAIDSLVPAQLQNSSADDFLQSLPQVHMLMLHVLPLHDEMLIACIGATAIRKDLQCKSAPGMLPQFCYFL